MNIPQTTKKRVVIIGGGFAGLNLANKLDSNLFQIVLVDKTNYHLFQPLLYQVATSGLEVSAITFPFRKGFQYKRDHYFRMATLQTIEPERNKIITSIGELEYDYLVIATGAETNFFGMKRIEEAALPMKSAGQAIVLRNHILRNIEKAVNIPDDVCPEALLNIVIVSGGASGVEVTGALLEMKRYILMKDYPELDISKVRIILIEGSDRLLRNMAPEASATAYNYLSKMSAEICLNEQVVDYDDGAVVLKSGNRILTDTLIWVSGVKSVRVGGLIETAYSSGGRLLVNPYNLINGYHNIYAIGDNCLQVHDDNYAKGHPQLAQVAIQQGKLLAENLKRGLNSTPLKPFAYKDLGSMATIGRNCAVVEIRDLHFGGFIAWVMWLVVHLFSLLGAKNKVQTAINWCWSYFSYDQSLRVIIEKEREK